MYAPVDGLFIETNMWKDFKDLYFKHEFLVGNESYDTHMAREWYNRCLIDMPFRQKLAKKWKVSRVIT